MRTKTFKDLGECTLICGAKGYKVYSIPNSESWLITSGDFELVTNDNVVTQYINLKYLPIDQQQKAIDDFEKMITDHERIFGSLLEAKKEVSRGNYNRRKKE